MIALTKALLDEPYGKIVDEVSWSLAQTVERTIQFHDIFLTNIKPTRLVNIHLFVRRKFGVGERRSNVTLRRNETEFRSQNHHCTDGGPFFDGQPCFKEFNTFLLAIPTSYKASFVLVGDAICPMFAFESPGSRKDSHGSSSTNISPSLKIAV